MEAYLFVLLLTSLLGHVLCDLSTRPPDKSYMIPRNATTVRGCKLMVSDPELPARIATIMQGSVKLVRLRIVIRGDNGVLNKSAVANMSDPYSWVFIFGDAGKSLLMLKDSFNPMSLFTLGFGVSEEHAVLHQNPPNCLRHVTEDEAGPLLRQLVMRNFQENRTGMSDAFPDGTQLCNVHIHEEVHQRTAKFRYKCCLEESQCYILERDTWMSVLLVIIFCIKVGVMLYSPLYVPNFLYRAKSVYFSYMVKAPEGLHMTVQISSTRPDNGFQSVTLESEESMESFKSRIETLSNEGKYRMQVNAIEIGVKANSILPENFAPVGPFAFINNFFFKCKMRHDILQLKDCCTADVLAFCCCRKRMKPRPWFRLLVIIMSFTAAIITLSPWLGRIAFYYNHEAAAIKVKRNAAMAKGLRTEPSDSLTRALSPEHPLFLAIYVAIPVQVVLFMILPKSIKSKVKFTVRRCFRDMLQTDRLAAVGYFFADCLWPLQKLGLIGLLLIPLWIAIVIPFRFLILLFEVIPVLNLTIRLLVNFFFYLLKTINPDAGSKSCPECTQFIFKRLRDFTRTVLVIDKKERNFRSNKVWHACGQFMCLVLMVISLTILFECVTFFLECFIYLMIGIILNPKDSLQYVSFVLLIVIYANDCFSSVRKRYLAFNKSINTNIKDLLGDRLTEVALLSATEQRNTAFTVEALNSDADVHTMQFLKGSNGHLKWNAPRLMMFLDNKDTACISKQFFFRACMFPYFGCPGPLYLSYFKAIAEFLLIILFLAFVFLVIMAFGHAHNVSSANQTIATLAGGFIPLMFRKFLFSSHAAPSVDCKDIKWKATFRNEVDIYQEEWVIHDLVLPDEGGVLPGDGRVFPDEGGVLPGDGGVLPDEGGIRKTDGDPDLIVVRQMTEENLEFFVPNSVLEVVYRV